MEDGSTYMKGNLKNYIDNLAGNLPPEIISPETFSQIYKMADLFADFAASEYIMETHLYTDAAEADFSWRVLTSEKECLTNGLKSEPLLALAASNTWAKIVDFINFWPPAMADIWLEMDYDELDKPIPQPCFFFNAGQIIKESQVDDELLYKALKHLLDDKQLESLWLNLQSIVHQLPSGIGLFQVGVMLARHSDRVRIFTAELTREQLLDYLSNIGWQGSFPQLQELFELVHPYSDGNYILDFDVIEQGASEKIGINFGLKTKEILPDFLENLISNQLCTEEKNQGVIAWPGSFGTYLGSGYGFTALLKDISHFKIACSPEAGLKAKAYLRVAGVYMKELFKNQNLQPIWSGQEEAKNRQMGYKEMQNLYKQIAQKSALDEEYRELCLTDSQAALQQLVVPEVEIPAMLFLEADDGVDYGNHAYILPPFIRKTWLTSSPKTAPTGTPDAPYGHD